MTKSGSYKANSLKEGKNKNSFLKSFLQNKSINDPENDLIQKTNTISIKKKQDKNLKNVKVVILKQQKLKNPPGPKIESQIEDILNSEDNEDKLFQAIQDYAEFFKNSNQIPKSDQGELLLEDADKQSLQTIIRKAKIVAKLEKIDDNLISENGQIIDRFFENGDFSTQEMHQIRSSKDLINKLLANMSQQAAKRYIKKNYTVFDRLYLEYLLSKINVKKKVMAKAKEQIKVELKTAQLFMNFGGSFTSPNSYIQSNKNMHRAKNGKNGIEKNRNKFQQNNTVRHHSLNLKNDKEYNELKVQGLSSYYLRKLLNQLVTRIILKNQEKQANLVKQTFKRKKNGVTQQLLEYQNKDTSDVVNYINVYRSNKNLICKIREKIVEGIGSLSQFSENLTNMGKRICLLI